MDYSQAYERFNLDKFLARLADKDYLESLDALNNEVRNAENIRTPAKGPDKRDIEHLQTSYVSNLRGFAFLLGQGIKPGGVSTEILLKFKPILEGLVKKEQLKESILELIE